jgi:protein TonB
MNAVVEPTQLTPGLVDTGDRLSFTLFLALVLHGILFLGVGFSLPKPATGSQTIEITLAHHKSANQPEQADFLAQHNQEASGTAEEARQLTTDQLADFADTQVQEINPLPQMQAATELQNAQQTLVTTIGSSEHQHQKNPETDPKVDQEQTEGMQEEQPLLMTEIASLQAKLDRQRQEQAKRPRIHRLTSVASRESIDARYLHDWSSRIEEVGNRNYPQEALNRRITGNLRLMVALNPDGTIYKVEILQGSGHRILDDAALQILRLAAPFEAFPPELRKLYDRLEIYRTWNFEISGLSTTSN